MRAGSLCAVHGETAVASRRGARLRLGALAASIALSCSVLAAPARAFGQSAESDEGPTTASGEARVIVRLTSPQPNVTFHRVAREGSASGAYERLCTAPCEARLPRGAHTLALSGVGEPMIAGSVLIRGPSHLTGIVTPGQQVTRDVGWTLLAFSFVLGIVPATTSAYALQAPGVDEALLAVTIVSAAVSIAVAIAGLVLGTSSSPDASIWLRSGNATVGRE